MGYYDGLSLDSDAASSYAVADALDMPVLFLVPCRGTALSIVPLLLGMLAFRENSHIKGILLNRCSGMLYPQLKEMIEQELSKHGYAIPGFGSFRKPAAPLGEPAFGTGASGGDRNNPQAAFCGGDAFKDNRRSGTVRSIAESGSVSEWEQRREHVPGCVREEQIRCRYSWQETVRFAFIMKTTSGFCENSGVN